MALGFALYQAVYPFVQTTLLAKVHYVMCCWSGSSPLSSGTPSILDTHGNCPLGYPAVAPSHGDPAAMVLQDRSLHAPAGYRWSSCWGMPAKSPGACVLDELVSPGSWHYPPQVSSRVNSPTLLVRGGGSFYKCWGAALL